MSESPSLRGFLEPIKDLTISQLGDACEAAFGNAVELFEESEFLYERGRCARAYYLAHIACEELGKLPILTSVATAIRLNMDIDWTRIDRALRSHEAKIKQVLFMDSLHVSGGLDEGVQAYEEDVARMRFYTDVKNSCLYSFHMGGRFAQPNLEVPREIYDSFRALVKGRIDAFESMYLKLPRDAGGLEPFLTGPSSSRAEELVQRLIGDEGLGALDEYNRSGDDSELRALFDELLPPDETEVDEKG